MISKEVVRQLLNEVPRRVAAHHANPNSVFITEEEMTQMCSMFPVPCILQALTNTKGALRSNPNMSREKVLKAVQNIANRIMVDGKAKGIYVGFCGLSAESPTYERTNNADSAYSEIILALRTEFQNQATDQSWTLDEGQAKDYLKQSGSAEVMRDAIQKLRKYSIDEFEEGLSALSAAIDQTLWLRTTDAFSQAEATR